ncbi:hypothetical protein ER308_11435 [Egibacter rhizosphaerae]|uniref:DUF1430 domain-containing protein n=1 Tax=Egibacter rhizosphaerae TaxID=1670831 RepID=A0A411YFT0_9ACTN|nr:hypothetical protein [Egibacter rhizosphaerae]QBI20115.1 hypothetical protein ER308_11435 [Egibacter rhizosphaerae]
MVLLRYRTIKLTHLVLLAASSLFAFLSLQDLDDVRVLGSDGDVWITGSDGSAETAQVARAVSSFARAHGVSVVREEADPAEPDTVTHLYVAAGNPESAPASWLAEGHVPFGHRMDVHVHAFEAISQGDARGVYHVYGSEEAAAALQDELTGLGLSGEVVAPFDLRQRFLYQAGAGAPLGLLFAVVALGAALTVGASVLLGARDYAVLRLHGTSFPRMLWHEAARVLPFWVFAAAGVVVVTSIVLALYNGFARAGLFLAVAAALAGVLSAVAAVAHVGALVAASSTKALRALKGGIPTKPSMVGVYLVRLCAALLVLLLSESAVESWQRTSQHEGSQEELAALGEDATYVALPGSRTRQAAEAMSEEVGEWLRRADERDQIIASYQWPMAQVLPEVGLPERRVLRVNETFLRQQPILDASGQRHAPDRDNEAVRVLIPESLQDHADAIVERVPELVDPEQAGAPVSDVEPAWSRDGQTVATLQSEQNTNSLGRVLVDDPVVIVVPNGSSVTSPANYTAMATSDGIIFPDRDDALSALGEEVSAEHVAGLAPVGHRAAAEHADAMHERRINVLSLTTAVLVLFVTGLAVAGIYGRHGAQAIFAKHVSGWSFWATHRKLFLLDALVASALVTWVGQSIWATINRVEQFAERGVPPPPNLPQADWWQLAAAAGVAVVATTLLMATTGLIHRRIVAEHAADA